MRNMLDQDGRREASQGASSEEVLEPKAEVTLMSDVNPHHDHSETVVASGGRCPFHDILETLSNWGTQNPTY
jgi:hypothetical protein